MAPEKRSTKRDIGSHRIPRANCPRRRSRKPGRLLQARRLAGSVQPVRGVQPFFLWPPVAPGPMLLILSVHSDDSIFQGENSCELRHNDREFPSYRNLILEFSQPTCTLGHLIWCNLYFAALDPSSAQPYTAIVDSWREVPAGSLALAERFVQ